MNNVPRIIGKEEGWANYLYLVKEYIEENNKLPLETVYSYSLGSWINKQKENYDPEITRCKKIMKKIEIYNLWKEFINDEKYKNYFTSNEEI